MNKEILEKLEDITNYIKESDTYKEYQILKDKINNNDKITNLIEEIKIKQKELVHKEYNHEDISKLEEELTTLEKKLNEIPLYCDFLTKQIELNNTFANIKNKIEECLDQYLN